MASKTVWHESELSSAMSSLQSFGLIGWKALEAVAAVVTLDRGDGQARFPQLVHFVQVCQTRNYEFFTKLSKVGK